MKTTRRTKRNPGIEAVRQLGNAAAARVEAARESAFAGVEAARETAAATVEEARTRTAKVVNQLEKAFEARVTKAMSRMGVPTSREVRALAREVASLKASVQKLSRSRGRARA